MMRNRDNTGFLQRPTVRQRGLRRRLDISGNQQLMRAGLNLQNARCVVTAPPASARRVKKAEFDTVPIPAISRATLLSTGEGWLARQDFADGNGRDKRLQSACVIEIGVADDKGVQRRNTVLAKVRYDYQYCRTGTTPIGWPGVIQQRVLLRAYENRKALPDIQYFGRNATMIGHRRPVNRARE